MSLASDDLSGTDRGDAPTALKPLAVRRDAPFSHWVRRAIIGDLLAAGLAATLATVIRFGPDHLDTVASGRQTAVSYTLVGILVTLAWPLLAATCGAYELR